MNPTRRILPGVLALLVLAPLPTLAEGSLGPLERLQVFTGFRGANVTSFARAGSLAFFTVDGPYTLQTLWRSDGTAGGTFPIGPRPVPQTVLRFLASHGDLSLFTWALDASPEDRSLWRSDGTDAGTFPIVQDLSFAADTGAGDSPTSLSVPGTGLAFFSAGPRSQNPDFELWATDGTEDGTRLVADVNPEGPSNPSFLVELGGRLFFLADTPQGRELWQSDGTEEGTERVQEFHEPGDAITALLRAGDALFLIVDKAPGVEVWRSDGTEAGTTRVLDLPSLDLQRFALADGPLFVHGRLDGLPQNHEIWAVDRNTGASLRVLHAVTSLDDLTLSAAGDGAFFHLATDRGLEPWWSDGTPGGTRRIANLCPGGTCISGPRFLGAFDGRAVLAVREDVEGHERPWLTDGTAAGTWPLGDRCSIECGTGLQFALDYNGALLLYDNYTLWSSDGTRNSLSAVGSLLGVLGWIALPDRLLLATLEPAVIGGSVGSLWSLAVTAPPEPPPGDWLASERVPGFLFKVRITETIAGRPSPSCMAGTLCVSGALPGRSEVFLRVVPRPNGYLWPTFIKLSTSLVEVWVQQTSTGRIRSYRLEASGATSTLSGVVDREGFIPAGPASAPAEALAASPPPPSGGWIVSGSVPGFRIKARIRSGGTAQAVRKEPCTDRTICLSGPQPGRPELLVRILGPMPNGRLWPALARFTTSAVEVWIEQVKTGAVRYYRLAGVPQGSSDLNGLFDRQGFRP